MTGRRVASVDALRGLVMLLMLVDHVRETVYLHAQVGDPADVTTTPAGLFFTRSLSHICAPVFIALTGLGAWFHGATHTRRETAVFLLERGAFLVLLEITVVGFAWTAEFPPSRPERAEPGSSMAGRRRARCTALPSDPWIRPLEAEAQGSGLAALLLNVRGLHGRLWTALAGWVHAPEEPDASAKTVLNTLMP